MQKANKVQELTKPWSHIDKILSNSDILLLIIEFIEDKDLLSFLLIKKATYSLIKKSKVIEIRVLKYELQNAEQALNELHANYPGLKHHKKKKEKLKTINHLYSSYAFMPFANLSLNNQKTNKNLINNMLFHTKLLSFVSQTLEKKKSFTKEINKLEDSKSLNAVLMESLQRDALYYQRNHSIYAYLDIAALKIYEKKEKVETAVEGLMHRFDGNQVETETKKVLKNIRYLCPAILIKGLAGTFQSISSYLISSNND